MKKIELESLYNTLKSDVSILPDTAQRDRIEVREDGHYGLTPKRAINSHEEMVMRVLNSIKPHFKVGDPNTFENLSNYPDEYKTLKNELTEEDLFCVTESMDIFLALVLLRIEGVIKLGKTPLCGTDNPIDFLHKIINESGLDYSDTLNALIDIPSLHGEEPFIKCKDESAAEKLDKAIMLLSLLSADDLIQYGDDKIDVQSVSILAPFYKNKTLSLVMPFVYLKAPQGRRIFKNYKFSNNSEWEQAASFFEKAHKILFDSDVDNEIAVDGDLLISLTRICAMGGYSIKPWLHSNTEKNENIQQWTFSDFDNEVESFIREHNGHFLLSMPEKEMYSFLTEDSSLDFRKYLVDNGFIRDIVYDNEDFGIIEYSSYIVDILKDGKRRDVRFFNMVNKWAGKGDNEHAQPKYLIQAFDGHPYIEDNRVFKFFSAEEIAKENYSLDPVLFTDNELVCAKNPVRLSELLSIEVANNSPSDYGDFNICINSHPKNCLDNYGEYEQADITFPDTQTTWFNQNSILFVKNSWPLSPSFHQRSESDTCTTEVISLIPKDGEEDGVHTCTEHIPSGLYVEDKLLGEDVMTFSINRSKVNPWYLAYKLEKSMQRQFCHRSHNGHISVDQFLRMFIDLPSMKEQKKFIEDIIAKDIEHKKIQVGASDVLFDLNHTIGSPALRIQSLLGNLMDTYAGQPDTFTQLKKIEDNFGYILRVIKAAGKDLDSEKTNNSQKLIVPLLNKYISASSSLPFGLDPKMDSTKIDNRQKVLVDEDFFYVMMDNIIRNAHRHGFDKKVSSNNKVFIDLSYARHEDRNWVVMSICNNGKKMDSSFSVYEYITKGAKGKTTGNTGQGGYDIYQIVRKFEGKICLRSNDQWNFIIDILLPINDFEDEPTINNYTYGPLV